MSISLFAVFLGCFFSSLILSCFIIPKVITIASLHSFFDLPNDRKVHTNKISNLGGVGIFLSFIFVSLFFLVTLVNKSDFYLSFFIARWSYILIGSVVLFTTGLKDDLIGLSPFKKFSAQALSSFFIAFFANIRLHSFYGLFGLNDLPYWWSVLLTIVGIMFVANAFNLIDGIDGLAGTLSALSLLSLSLFFILNKNYSEAIISTSLLGAVIGFLYFNLSPAKIFMGDSGAIVLGFLLSVLTILFIENIEVNNSIQNLVASPGSAMLIGGTILLIPVFDTFRVFVLRIIKGKSPFFADRNHLHHKLLDAKFTHTQIVITYLIVYLILLLVVYFSHFYSSTVSSISLVVSITIILLFFYYFLNKFRK